MTADPEEVEDPTGRLRKGMRVAMESSVRAGLNFATWEIVKLTLPIGIPDPELLMAECRSVYDGSPFKTYATFLVEAP